MERFKYQRPHEANPEDPSTHDITLEVGDKEVGYARMLYASSPLPLYEVGLLHVNEEERGKGFGSKLMAEVERLLKEKGKAGVLHEGIAVHTPGSPAIGMYERRGWLPIPGAKDWYAFNLPEGYDITNLRYFSERTHTPQRMDRVMRRLDEREASAETGQ